MTAERFAAPLARERALRLNPQDRAARPRGIVGVKAVKRVAAQAARRGCGGRPVWRTPLGEKVVEGWRLRHDRFITA